MEEFDDEAPAKVTSTLTSHVDTRPKDKPLPSDVTQACQTKLTESAAYISGLGCDSNCSDEITKRSELHEAIRRLASGSKTGDFVETVLKLFCSTKELLILYVELNGDVTKDGPLTVCMGTGMAKLAALTSAKQSLSSAMSTNTVDFVIGNTLVANVDTLQLTLTTAMYKHHVECLQETNGTQSEGLTITLEKAVLGDPQGKKHWWKGLKKGVALTDVDKHMQAKLRKCAIVACETMLPTLQDHIDGLRTLKDKYNVDITKDGIPEAVQLWREGRARYYEGVLIAVMVKYDDKKKRVAPVKKKKEQAVLDDAAYDLVCEFVTALVDRSQSVLDL